MKQFQSEKKTIPITVFLALHFPHKLFMKCKSCVDDKADSLQNGAFMSLKILKE